MLPSVSVASIVAVIVAGEVKTEPLGGEVMTTLGGALTMIVTGADVVEAPWLSKARAVERGHHLAAQRLGLYLPGDDHGDD